MELCKTRMPKFNNKVVVRKDPHTISWESVHVFRWVLIIRYIWGNYPEMCTAEEAISSPSCSTHYLSKEGSLGKSHTRSASVTNSAWKSWRYPTTRRCPRSLASLRAWGGSTNPYVPQAQCAEAERAEALSSSSLAPRKDNSAKEFKLATSWRDQ